MKDNLVHGQLSIARLSLVAMDYRLLTIVLLLFVNALANAQDQGEIQKVEYEIVKDREIKLPQASRNFEKVPPRAAEPIKPEIDYNFKN
ncbi:MAG: hypothetical protein ACK55U_08710, partial [Bacteroidota bacterium]